MVGKKHEDEHQGLLSGVRVRRGDGEAAAAPGAIMWYDKPLIPEASLNTWSATNTLWVVLVAIPAVVTLLGYLMINLGNAPPDAGDQSALNQFLATSLGMGLAAAVSALTNFIFTAIPMHKGAYHSALKEDSWSARNLAKVAGATLGGVASGVNYIPLMRKVVPQLLLNLSINSKAAEVFTEAIAYSFIATMMLLNIAAIYHIIFEVLTPGAIKLKEKYAEKIREHRNCVTALVPAIKEAVGITTTSAAIEGAGVLLASAGVGIFYYTQLAKYISAENKSGGFDMIPLNAAYFIALGDLAFGLFFAEDGFKEVLEGLKDMANHPSVCAILNKSLFGMAAFTWSLFTIIPAMAQGQPGISKDLMALTSVIFNFPASVRVVNALAELMLLNLKNALWALYKTKAHAGLEEEALSPGFNTCAPFASFRDNSYTRLCRVGQGYESMTDAAPQT